MKRSRTEPTRSDAMNKSSAVNELRLGLVLHRTDVRSVPPSEASETNLHHVPFSNHFLGRSFSSHHLDAKLFCSVVKQFKLTDQSPVVYLREPTTNSLYFSFILIFVSVAVAGNLTAACTTCLTASWSITLFDLSFCPSVSLSVYPALTDWICCVNNW